MVQTAVVEDLHRRSGAMYQSDIHHSSPRYHPHFHHSCHHDRSSPRNLLPWLSHHRALASSKALIIQFQNIWYSKHWVCFQSKLLVWRQRSSSKLISFDTQSNSSSLHHHQEEVSLVTIEGTDNYKRYHRNRKEQIYDVDFFCTCYYFAMMHTCYSVLIKCFF